MQDVFISNEVSLWVLKSIGIFLTVLAGIYLIFTFESHTKTSPNWKRLLILSLGSATLNAGLTIVFGKNVFIITPVFIMTIIAFWFFKKIPFWNKKQIISFLSLFTIFSVSIFIVATATFFHLAVEGKI